LLLTSKRAQIGARHAESGRLAGGGITKSSDSDHSESHEASIKLTAFWKRFRA